MKATLVFNLPAERNEHELALNGSKLSAAVDKYDNLLRNRVKYENKNYIRVDEARRLLQECLDHYGLSIGM